MNRRNFLAAAVATTTATYARSTQLKPLRIVLRSSWQTVNIGDIAHTPGMLALLEKHRPDAEVTLWPSSVSDGVEKLLKTRFPKLTIAQTNAEKEAALKACDFFLHGSGPGLVGKDLPAARTATAKAKLLADEKMAKMIAAVPR